MKILILGGTRFIGRYLVKRLLAEGHQLTLFTRGNQPIPGQIEHIKGDRKNQQDLSPLSKKSFDVIIDTSGRTLDDTKNVLEVTGHPQFRFVYISSAGIYKKSEILPLTEKSIVDDSSRHIGKSNTEEWLLSERIAFTSFRPTYIYGPGNYNPIERWFFDRIINKRPIPLPGDGSTITQLGHVDDLANAITISIGSDIANNKIYNCSGKNAVTFSGLVSLASRACNIDPIEIKLVSFDINGLDKKARKAFPLRLEHFYTDISLLETELGWSPNYELEDGFKDSFKNDYLLYPSTNLDFSLDSNLIG